MSHRSPVPENFLPGQLLLRTEGTCDLDPGHLLEVFGRQRQRFVTVLRGFGPDDWAAPPGAPTGPRTTSSDTCATATRSQLAPMTTRSTSPLASTRESPHGGGQ